MIDGIFEAAPVGELHDALALPRGVRVGVGDVSGGTEVILQVLKSK